MEKCRMKPNTLPTHSTPLLDTHSGSKRWRSTTNLSNTYVGPFWYSFSLAPLQCCSLSTSVDTIQLAVSDFLSEPREMDNARWDRERRS